MHPTIVSKRPSDAEPTNKFLGSLSVLTMLLTFPQVWSIWIRHQASGVSVISWLAYLISALAWFFHGIHRKDKNIYLPCIGWILLDLAIVTGTILYR
jgi:uncharacterized protein with PQ loop repeat